jgi:hypothetical protein
LQWGQYATELNVLGKIYHSPVTVVKRKPQGVGRQRHHVSDVDHRPSAIDDRIKEALYPINQVG